MKKLKNSKYKNTGFILDVLIRNMTTEILNSKDQNSINIIRKYFNKNTELSKEVRIYQTLSENGKSKNICEKLIDAVKQTHKSIDRHKLSKEKYKLIGEIQEKFDIKNFFDTRVEKYPIYASIYKLLEYSIEDNPETYLTNREFLIESISKTENGSTAKTVEDVIYENSQTPDDRKMIFRSLIKMFNEKYSRLNSPQKKLLTKFINENTTDTAFLRFCQLEASKVKTALKLISEKTPDPVLKIKLAELSKLAVLVENATKMKDSHVSSLLKFYELIYTLENK